MLGWGYYVLTESRGTPPLCPAGHLPLKGGDYTFIDVGTNRKRCRTRLERRVSQSPPLRGEMPGRAEGGYCPTHASVKKL